MNTVIMIADTNRVLLIYNQAVVGFLSTLNRHASSTLEWQSHKATKREKRDRSLGALATRSGAATYSCLANSAETRRIPAYIIE
jgi:hypothetical protein